MLIARWVGKGHLLRDNEPWNPMKQHFAFSVRVLIKKVHGPIRTKLIPRVHSIDSIP